MLTLLRLLAAHEDAIIDAGPAWVRETAAGDLGGRPQGETRGLVADDVRAPAALLQTGDPRPHDLVIEPVTAVRSGQHIRASTLLRGCFAPHRALEPLLARHSFSADAPA